MSGEIVINREFLNFHMDLISSTFYCIISFGLTLLNKVIVTRFFFDYPTVIMMLQMATLLFAIELMRVFGVVKIPPYTFDRGKDMILCSVCFSLNAYLSLTYLDGMTLPMYGIIKRFVPGFALYFTLAILKRNVPTRRQVILVAIISFACAFACLDDAIYGYFDTWSYVYGFGAVVFQALYMIQIEKIHQSKQYSALELTYMNAFNGLVGFLITDLIQDEIRDAFMYFITSSSRMFWFLFVGMLLVGSLMNFAIFHAIIHTDAVCIGLVGNVKQAIFILFSWIFGLYIFLDMAPVASNILACLVVLAAFSVYTYDRQIDKINTRGRKFVDSGIRI